MASFGVPTLDAQDAFHVAHYGLDAAPNAGPWPNIANTAGKFYGNSAGGSVAGVAGPGLMNSSTPGNRSRVPGKFNFAQAADFPATTADFSSLGTQAAKTFSLLAASEVTISVWCLLSSTIPGGAGTLIIPYSEHDTVKATRFSFNVRVAPLLGDVWVTRNRLGGPDNEQSKTTGNPVPFDVATMITIVYSVARGEVLVYVDGVKVLTDSLTLTQLVSNGTFDGIQMTRRVTPGSWQGNTDVWNGFAAQDAFVTALWNGGAGVDFTSDVTPPGPPTVVLKLRYQRADASFAVLGQGVIPGDADFSHMLLTRADDPNAVAGTHSWEKKAGNLSEWVLNAASVDPVQIGVDVPLMPGAGDDTGFYADEDAATDKAYFLQAVDLSNNKSDEEKALVVSTGLPGIPGKFNPGLERLR